MVLARSRSCCSLHAADMRYLCYCSSLTIGIRPAPQLCTHLACRSSSCALRTFSPHPMDPKAHAQPSSYHACALLAGRLQGQRRFSVLSPRAQWHKDGENRRTPGICRACPCCRAQPGRHNTGIHVGGATQGRPLAASATSRARDWAAQCHACCSAPVHPRRVRDVPVHQAHRIVRYKWINQVPDPLLARRGTRTRARAERSAITQPRRRSR